MATLGPMQDMGMDFKHLGVLARPHTLRNLVLHSCINQKLVRNSGNLAWCHGMAHMCPDDKLSDLGQVLAQALTNLSYSREASFCGFDKERVTLCGRIDIRCLFSI